jgi:2-amino-4-hydroxy-6-hydroxymethyldihydropteridine diphosphokinase
MVEVALSLGSNLGDRREHLTGALQVLASEVLMEMEVSSLWESAPVEVAGTQPLYLNICAVGRTILSPEETLDRCQGLERLAGREPGSHGLPRPLDIDILYHGDTSSAEARLQIPHPGLDRRAFVLAPLAEMRGDWSHPATGLTVDEMLSGLDMGQELTIVDGNRNWWCRE